MKEDNCKIDNNHYKNISKEGLKISNFIQMITGWHMAEVTVTVTVTVTQNFWWAENIYQNYLL